MSYFPGIKSVKQDQKLLPTTNSKILERFIPPTGYKRVVYDTETFAYYLQHLPLKPEGSKVYLYNGKEKHNQSFHAAVIKVSVGNRDLQQCADAVIRLRADYLYSQGRYEDIAFNFVSDGKPRLFIDYCNNYSDLSCYKKYLNYVFSYANTRSLKGQLIKINSFDEINAGDVLIQSGNPYGHAVIVVDLVINEVSGDKLFLLAQSYMPAQDIHILKNISDKTISPWYRIPRGDKINTPEWIFYRNDLYRFR